MFEQIVIVLSNVSVFCLKGAANLSRVVTKQIATLNLNRNCNFKPFYRPINVRADVWKIKLSKNYVVRLRVLHCERVSRLCCNYPGNFLHFLARLLTITRCVAGLGRQFSERLSPLNWAQTWIVRFSRNYNCGTLTCSYGGHNSTQLTKTYSQKLLHIRMREATMHLNYCSCGATQN